MFDYKEYLKPLQKWLEELEEQGIDKHGEKEKVLAQVTYEVYEPISLLVEDYIYRMEHKDE